MTTKTIREILALTASAHATAERVKQQTKRTKHHG